MNMTTKLAMEKAGRICGSIARDMQRVSERTEDDKPKSSPCLELQYDRIDHTDVRLTVAIERLEGPTVS